jgi:hypothetical protein
VAVFVEAGRLNDSRGVRGLMNRDLFILLFDAQSKELL